MSISSITSSSITTAIMAKPEPPVQATTEATSTNSGRNLQKDGDRDDRIAANQAPVKPEVVVNSNGQKIGNIINTTA